VPFLPTLKTLNLYYPYSPYHPFFYSTLHYSTLQYFKLILGYCYFFLCLFLLSAILGQVPEPFATKTQLFSPSLKFFPQFGKGVFFFEQVTYNRVILFQRHGGMSLEEVTDLVAILAI